MSYKQKAIQKLEELEEGTRGVIGATMRMCVMLLKEIPEEYPKELLKEVQDEDAWIPASEPPKESMDVIVCLADEAGRISSIMNVHYSTKYKAFDWCDGFDPNNAIHPQYWKPMPERVKDLRIRAPKRA